MSVQICGSVLSSLFYENSNTSGDTEGLLLGRVNSHVTDTISDTQISNVKEETFISVYAYLRCSAALSWYDNSGRVDKRKLQAVLPADSRKDVIGWYKFRRNSRLAVSMRERAIHKSLRREFLDRHDDHFLFLLCGSEEILNQPTLSYTHVFHTFGPTGIKSLSSEILNAGDTTHNEYKKSKVTQHEDTDIFSQSLLSLRGQFQTSEGEMQSVASLRQLKYTVQEQLQDLCSKVARSEDLLGKLRTEIKDMKHRLAVKQAPVEKERIEDVPTTSQAPAVARRPEYAHGDVSLETPRQRLSGSGSSPKQRRMSGLSDFSSTRQFDFRETFDDPSQDDISAGGNAATVEMQEEMPDLMSFDEENENIQNQEKDSTFGFEDSFVNLNVNMPPSSTQVRTPNVQTSSTLPTVLIPQPAQATKTLKEMANEMNVQKSGSPSESMDLDEMCNDPFSGLATLQRRQVQNALMQKARKQTRTVQNTDQGRVQGQSTATRSTRSQVQGHTTQVQGQAKVVPPFTTPEKPVIVDSDDQASPRESDSPSF